MYTSNFDEFQLFHDYTTMDSSVDTHIIETLLFCRCLSTAYFSQTKIIQHPNTNFNVSSRVLGEQFNGLVFLLFLVILDETWRRNSTQSSTPSISVLQFEIKPARTHPDVEKEEQLITSHQFQAVQENKQNLLVVVHDKLVQPYPQQQDPP